MMTLMAPNTSIEPASMISRTGLARSPRRASTKPNRIEISTTGNMSPRAKASITVFGMMLSTNSAMVCSFALPAYCATAVCIERRRIHVEPGARRSDVARREEADQEGERGHDLEVEQGLAPRRG